MAKPDHRDEVLFGALRRLKSRFRESAWVRCELPFTTLHSDCTTLATDAALMSDVRAYVASRTIVRRAVSTFFTFIAMSARAKWEDVPEQHRGIAARGWFLGRWLPTFLVIDGPIGRFLLADSSPFAKHFGPACPVFTAARDMMADKAFRSLRNGFAHWGFDWEVMGHDSYVVAYDWDRDLPIAKLHQEEADAFHFCAFALVEVVHDVFLAPEREPLEQREV